VGTFDQYADRVLDAILAAGGVYASGDAGEVLHNLAVDADVPYKAVSLVVIRLEGMGFVEVDRLTHREAHRANKIVSIAIA